MILKYEKGNVWGFIDHVSQAAHKNIDLDFLERQYDDERSKMPCEKDYQDPAEYMNGKRLSEEVVKSNKAFCMATELPDEGMNRHSENLLDESKLDMPAQSILLYLEDCKDYDAVQLITNQRAYLMNDKGQTIERLN